MNDSDLMPFGPFKDEEMESVPDWYLLGIEKNYENMFSFVPDHYPEVLEYVQENYDTLQGNSKKEEY